jgi:hypothetical protein
MADTLLQTPYSTAMPYVVAASAGGWQAEYDRQRLLSYDFYDDAYNNEPGAKLLLRSADDQPVLVPTAKRLINALARYVGKGWGYKVLSVDPLSEEGVEATDEQILEAQRQFGLLFARERLLTTFRAGIPEWLRRGDWLWMISADPLKREGRRISVRPIDPRRYYPLYNDPTDASRLTGQQLIEEVVIGDKIALFVQTWLKATDPNHPDNGSQEPEDGFSITYEAQAYDVAEFNDPAKRKALAYPGNLPQSDLEGISNLPIYHIKNNETTDDPFGRSDLSGLESLIAGINQTITDEDLALALTGLGMYWTDSGSPVDEVTGQPTPWKLGPKRVIETDTGTAFNRVQGITSVEPSQTHTEYMEERAFGTAGLSDVSIGTTDQATAESGIALAIRFSPTEDTVQVKNEALNAVLTQMFHDLKEWLNVFEGVDLGPVVVISETDDQSLLPFNREARWKELMEGIVAKVFTPEYAVGVLEEEFGYEFPPNYISTLTAANAAAAAAEDPFADRANAELNASDNEETDAGDDAGVAEDGA